MYLFFRCFTIKYQGKCLGTSSDFKGEIFCNLEIHSEKLDIYDKSIYDNYVV